MGAWLLSLMVLILAWNASEHAVGYRLSYGLAPSQYSTVLDVGPFTTASVAGLDVGQTYYFAATAYNAAGESGFSNEVSGTTSPQPPPPPSDMAPPTVVITSPTQGATVTRKGVVTLAADASDNVGVTRVEFYVNGRLQCADGTAPYGCSWPVPAPPNRAYNLQARAIDAAGNVGSSSVITVTASR